MPLDGEHMQGLRPKQRRFVAEFVTSGNATDAARKAGYSQRTAEVIGHENLRKPKIAHAIDVETKRVGDQIGVTQEWVLQRLKEEATAGDGSPTDATASSRNSALNTLSKCLGMQLDRQEQTVKAAVSLDSGLSDV